MFFRRERPKIPSFSERIELLKQAGFATRPLQDGRVVIEKHGVGAAVGDEGKALPFITKSGVIVGGDIAVLVAGGYQEFLELPSGRRLPATSEQLHSLHEFEEDVKAALGIPDLYNTSLGTVSRKPDYDRVWKRDIGQQPKPWERKDNRLAAPNTKAANRIP
jgi:hypothetical protein